MKKLALILCTSALSLACGSDTSTPWDPNSTTVRSADGTTTALDLGDCSDDTAAICDAVDEECGDAGAADVYVDEAGDVVSIVCFPNQGDGEVKTLSGVDGSDEEAVVGNNDTIVLVGDADSPAVSGDLEVNGNNPIIYGDAPEDAVIAGDLDLNANNAVITGVTVTGNLLVNEDANDLGLSNCVIEGNLVIEANNATVIGCRIDGNIEVKGNGATLSGNEVVGNIEVEGNGAECTENLKLKDDGTTEPLGC